MGSYLYSILKKCPQYLLPVLLVGLSSSVLAVDILVRATAREDYIRAVDAEGNPAQERYVFHQGQYYPAEYEDDEEAIIFEEVAYAIKEELIKKNYIMAADPMDAEFILVLHWGQTNSDPNDDEFEWVDDSDPDNIIDYGGSLENDLRERENAKIIGATSLYEMHAYSMKRQQLEEAARHDRYFVVVNAFSIEELKNRKEAKEISPPLWTLQLSLPAGRTHPEEAFGTLAKTAGRYSGENLLNTDFIRENEKKGIVRIGKLEFIETIPEETAEPAKE